MAAKAGKTLKLRSGTPAAAMQPQAGAAPRPAAAAAPEEEPVDSMAMAGVGYFLPSAAAVVLVVVAIVYNIRSAQLLFGQLF
jgi:hypothetical protein